LFVYEHIGAIGVQRGRLPSGDAGTKKTLEIMRQLAAAGARDPSVREAAIQAVQSDLADGHDAISQLHAIFNYARDRISFVGDTTGIETLQSPRYTLSVRAGDCDDKATLMVAMARSIGIPATFDFKVVAAQPPSPAFSHVYVVAHVAGHDIAMDPTYSTNSFGWELSGRLRRGSLST
jgi:transglutaminase-like putative cysteine protease